MNILNETSTGVNTVVSHDRKRQERVRMAFSYSLAIACLVWVFHDYDFTDLIHRTAKMNLLLATLAIICDVSSFVCQGWRWRLLLRPFGSVSVFRTTQAIYSGMFVNEVLPMKVGELLRAYLISRWNSVKLATVFTSIIIERLFDGFWLAAAFVVIMLLLPLPRKLLEVGDVFSALVLILVSILLAVGLSRTPIKTLTTVFGGGGDSNKRERIAEVKRSPVKLSLLRLLLARLDRVGVALRVILHSPASLVAFALSLLLMSLQWFAFWLMMLAFGLHLSVTAAAAVFVIVHVGTLLPGAPANIGTYQVVTVLGLTLFGVDRTAAAGFSLVVFVLLSVHTWVIGFWALRRSGLTLFGMRAELSNSLTRIQTVVQFDQRSEADNPPTRTGC